jgi:anti-sigma regulatory factor (Ser/Thr protein kinase)
MQRAMDMFDRTYAATPESIARVRADIGSFAAGHGMAARRLDDVRLAVSEAVTNAVMHGYRDVVGTVHATATLTDGALWISIRDFGCGMQPQPIATGRAGMGLGLALIGRLVSEMKVAPQPGGGTDLRMRFELMSAPLSAGRSSTVVG